MSAADRQRPAGFNGYFQRDIPAEDAELTHVGPGTPCGEYLRRIWQPVAMSSELADLPIPLRILGEDLVAFRDHSGNVGVLHRHCSHRGASLEYGIVMERGISCCYHGWHYDVDGSLIDTPSEPADSPIKRNVVQGAYPAMEYNGLVFAYLGPPDERPEFPVYDTLHMDATEAIPFSISTPCNWLQVYENTQDPIHVIHLHARSSGVQFGAASGVSQVIEYRETPLGMINVQTRHVGDRLWNRTTDSILPNCNQTGAIWEEAEAEKTFRRVSMTRWMVPIDDTHTVTIGWRYHNQWLDPRGQDDLAIIGKESIDFMGQTADRSYDERRRQPGDYEAQVSQRPIAVHALENRATSDRGVVMLRRLIREGIRSIASGNRLPPPGAEPISTFCQDTVFPYPAAPTGIRGDDDEHALLLRFGRRVADIVIESAGLPQQQRETRINDICAQEFSESALAEAN